MSKTSNIGNSIIISTCLIIGNIYGFEFNLIIFLALSCIMWLHTPEDVLNIQKEKLSLEIELLKKKIRSYK